MHQVYLVPGFFGFARLGTLSYFHRVRQVLDEALLARGIQADIREVDTEPTASIRRRASLLIDQVVANGGLEARTLHFIGHSTGGLDVRLLLAPNVRISSTAAEERILARTRSATWVSVPHWGTPLANFFTSLNGRFILKLLATLACSNPGRLGVWAVARSLGGIARLDDYLGERDTVLDAWAEGLFRQISTEERDQFWTFLRSVAHDQGAMVQLTPEAMDLFNASVLDPPDITPTCVLTAAPRPAPRTFLSGNAYDRLTAVLFAICYGIASDEHRTYAYPRPEAGLAETLRQALPFAVSAQTSDGVVPTWSQVRGRVLGAVSADHLDVVGQFPHQAAGRHYAGWLHSGSGFRDSDFCRIWGEVAEVIREGIG